MNPLGAMACAAGKGLFAGVAGTAAMTASSTIEMKLRGRPASTTPAVAACKVLGIELAEEQQKAGFANAVHWLYGTAWGSMRGYLALAQLPPLGAAAAFFATVWGTELAMLPKLGVTPPVSQWGTTEIAVDAFHHAVYAAATSCAYMLLEQ